MNITFEQLQEFAFKATEALQEDGIPVRIEVELADVLSVPVGRHMVISWVKDDQHKYIAISL